MQTPPARSSLDHFSPHVSQFVDGPIRVRALQTGYYGHTIRRPGDEFGIHTMAEFGEWMELVAETPDAADPVDDLDDDLDHELDREPAAEQKKSGKKAGTDVL